MSSHKSVFFLGATGYIGSAVLSKLLQHQTPSHITVLARNGPKVELINTLKDSRLRSVQGDLRDINLIEELASKHDVILNTADADALEANKAILRGMAKRKALTGVASLLIHTSGTGVLSDTANGLHSTDIVYSDRIPDNDSTTGLTYVDSVPDTAFHRDVDLAIIAADDKEDLRSYIIFPSTIYGLNDSFLVQKGIGNPHSIQMPAAIKASLARKRPGMIGSGLNMWPNVHISDISDLFITVYDLALGDDGGNHGRNGYFFGENGEHTLLAAAQVYGKAMYELGLTDNAEPTTFTNDEIDKYFEGNSYLGSNARCRGEKSRDIGWKPIHGLDDFYASLYAEVRAIAAAAGPSLQGLKHTKMYSELGAARPGERAGVE